MITNLGQILTQSAAHYPRKAAIIFGQKKINFSELNLFSDRLAQGLRESGVGKGDRVALLLDNSPHFIICYFAIVKLGATVIPINHMFKYDEASFVVSDSKASALITSAAYLDMALKIKENFSHLKGIFTTSKARKDIISIYEWIYDPSKNFTAQNVDSGDIAVILYTSGTT